MSKEELLGLIQTFDEEIATTENRIESLKKAIALREKAKSTPAPTLTTNKTEAKPESSTASAKNARKGEEAGSKKAVPRRLLEEEEDKKRVFKSVTEKILFQNKRTIALAYGELDHLHKGLNDTVQQELKRRFHEQTRSEAKSDAKSDAKSEAKWKPRGFSLLKHAICLTPNPSLCPVFQHNLRSFVKSRSSLMKVLYKRKRQEHEEELKLARKHYKLTHMWEDYQAKRESRMARTRKKHLNPMSPGSRGGVRVRRRGDYAKSDAEWRQVLAEFQATERRKELGEKNKAIIPDMLSRRERQFRGFVNNNGLIEDVREYNRREKNDNPWTEQEKDIFIKKYARYPNNFLKISLFLPRKSVNDCVAFHFLKKESLNYQKLVKQAKKRTRTRLQPAPIRKPTTLGSPSDASQLGSPNSLDEGDDEYDDDDENTAQMPIAAAASSSNTRHSNKAHGQKKRASRSGKSDQQHTTRPYWTDEEKNLFFEGVDLFGKDFQAISNKVGTKGVDKCRNFFNNNKRKHNLEERVRKANAMMGKSHLNKKPRSTRGSMPRRYAKRAVVKAREQMQAEQALTGKAWTKEEKASLVSALHRFGQDWAKVANAVRTRTPGQVEDYYNAFKEKLGLEKAAESEREPAGHNRNPQPPSSSHARAEAAAATSSVGIGVREAGARADVDRGGGVGGGGEGASPTRAGMQQHHHLHHPHQPQHQQHLQRADEEFTTVAGSGPGVVKYMAGSAPVMGSVGDGKEMMEYEMGIILEAEPRVPVEMGVPFTWTPNPQATEMSFGYQRYRPSCLWPVST
uniref:Uncharacterized protein n=1 Tax=Lotharella globosa TaxID=91324 RepID=A0A7S4DI29_9EUKA